MRAILLALLLFAPVAASTAPASAEAELPIAKALPLAKALVGQGASKLSIPELERGVDQRLSRLLVGDEHAALDTPKDIEELLVLAVQVQTLQARGENSRALRASALSTAYMIHLAGHAYETRKHVRDSFDSLLERLSEDQKPGFQLMLETLPKMRDFGKRWFPEALSVVLKDDPQQPWVHNQRGLWLYREGRHEQAAEAFAMALNKGMKARYAENLYRALLQDEKTGQAAALRARTLKIEPLLENALEQIRVSVEDDVLTEHYERHAEKASLDEALSQTHRYLRLGRVGAAHVLGAKLVDAHPSDPKVLATIAEVYAMTSKPERLSHILEKAATQGELSIRLREMRVAQAIQSRMDRVFSGVTNPLADHDVSEDVAAIVAAHGEDAKILGVLPDVLEAVATWIKARNDGATEPTKAHLDKLAAAVDRGYEALPGSPRMVLLETAGLIALDQSDAAMKTLAKRRRTVPKAARPELGFLLARMQLGYGVRRLDKTLARKGAVAIAKLSPGPGVAKSELTYAQLVAPVVVAVLDGKTLPATGSKRAPGAREVLKGLPRHDLDFDVTSTAGALHAEGIVLTVGALLMALDDQGNARDALKEVRKINPDAALAKLAAAQAALIAGDGGGALQLLYEGLGRSVRPSEAFAIHKWISYTANLVKDQQRAVHHITAMLKLWDEAGVPDVVSARSPRPLFIGDFHIGVMLKPGAPLAAELRAIPVVVLIADVPHKKSELEALIRDAAKANP